MSIFEGRELWSSTCDAAENFEGNCLAIGPPNAFKQNGVLILMASPSGLLRAYLLHGEGHAVNDLILETNLGLPIVQIEFGWFGEDAENTSIVILHPRKVVICTLQFDEFAARYNLLHLLPQKVHQLEEAAYGMIIDRFGSAATDCICVQSTEGKLSFLKEKCFFPYLASTTLFFRVL